MSTTNANKHLTLNERRIILEGITNGAKKSAIADTLGKDKSTIGKEIKLHREKKHSFSLPLECANYKQCTHNRKCIKECCDYKQFKCNRRDRSPGACNGCPKYSYCRFNKYYYSPELAQSEYYSSLIHTRQGINLTAEEAHTMGTIIAPLIKNGLSPYQILEIHPELNICEQTLYNYIAQGVFAAEGVINLDLRRKVSRKINKGDKNAYKKREDRTFLKGRLYSNYNEYMEEHPNASVTQMDTVYNDGENGPFMQTFKFMKNGFLLSLYHIEKTANEMLNGINLLDQILGEELFNKYCEVILTDRGSEFAYADKMELRDDGTTRTHIFYCDPMASGQKGSLENNHEELRYIFPKGTDLKELGLTSQENLNIVISHINSAPKEKLEGKSPIELMKFLHPDLWKKLSNFGICEIDKDMIILKPYLLKK